MSEFSDYIRTSFKRGDKKRDEGLSTPDSILRIDDISYGKDKSYQILDIYCPKDKKDQKLPVIVNVHGGGFVYGTKETYQFYCMKLAQYGFRVINFSYRLAPESKFPAQLEDTNAVFHFIYDNKEKYHFDLNNLFAIGDSAGANILGIYTGLLASNDPDPFKLRLPDLKIKAIALNHGCYDHLKQDPKLDNGLTLELAKDLFEEKPINEALKDLIVPNYIDQNYPPCFIVSSSDDFLREQPLILIEKLTQCKIPFIYRFFSKEDIELEHVFHLNIRSEDAKICNEEEIEFFRTFIK